MIQPKRILFSVGLGVITLAILMVIINPLELDFNEIGVKFTGLFALNRTLNETEPLLESLQETTTTSVVTTSTSSTTVLTTTSPVTTITTTTTSTSTTTIPPANHVVFSEVFYDTPDDDIEEWIELYNPTSESIDISGLTIEDNSRTYKIPNGTIIDFRDFLVIARNRTAFYDLYGDYPDISGLTLELNDNGDKLILKNGSDEIDIVAWEDVSGWDLKADEDESIQRDPPNKDTNTDDDWKSHTNPDPDTGGLITTSSSTTTTIPVTTSTTTSSTTTTTTPTFGSLLVSVSVKNETIVRGNNQTIITMVTDGTNPIENALVNVTVKYASNEVYNWCNGLTNSTGIFICSYKIDGGSTPGTFVATSTATKDGYITGIGNVSFEVIAAS